jgi:hypothetical protein
VVRQPASDVVADDAAEAGAVVLDPADRPMPDELMVTLLTAMWAGVNVDHCGAEVCASTRQPGFTKCCTCSCAPCVEYARLAQGVVERRLAFVLRLWWWRTCDRLSALRARMEGPGRLRRLLDPRVPHEDLVMDHGRLRRAQRPWYLKPEEHEEA